MQQIIDRRLAGKNKSIGNRERFLRRHKDQIREAVKRAVDGRGIRDMEKGEDIHIPRRDISEPVFGHGQGGKREMVHPGNQDYVRGDRIERPKGGGGGGGGGPFGSVGGGQGQGQASASQESEERAHGRPGATVQHQPRRGAWRVRPERLQCLPRRQDARAPQHWPCAWCW